MEAIVHELCSLGDLKVISLGFAKTELLFVSVQFNVEEPFVFLEAKASESVEDRVLVVSGVHIVPKSVEITLTVVLSLLSSVGVVERDPRVRVLIVTALVLVSFDKIDSLQFVLPVSVHEFGPVHFVLDQCDLFGGVDVSFGLEAQQLLWVSSVVLRHSVVHNEVHSLLIRTASPSLGVLGHHHLVLVVFINHAQIEQVIIQFSPRRKSLLLAGHNPEVELTTIADVSDQLDIVQSGPGGSQSSALASGQSVPVVRPHGLFVEKHGVGAAVARRVSSDLQVGVFSGESQDCASLENVRQFELDVGPLGDVAAPIGRTVERGVVDSSRVKDIVVIESVDF